MFLGSWIRIRLSEVYVTLRSSKHGLDLGSGQNLYSTGIFGRVHGSKKHRITDPHHCLRYWIIPLLFNSLTLGTSPAGDGQARAQGGTGRTRKVHPGQHPRAGQRKVALSSLQQKVQSGRICTQTHLQQACREGGGRQGGCGIFQQFPARPTPAPAAGEAEAESSSAAAAATSRPRGKAAAAWARGSQGWYAAAGRGRTSQRKHQGAARLPPGDRADNPQCTGPPRHGGLQRCGFSRPGFLLMKISAVTD